MKNLYILISIFIGFNLNAQQWQWASSFGNANNDNSSTMDIDPSGNIFVGGGYFNTSLTIGSNILGNAGGGDVYIAKYSPTGTVMWAQNISGSGADYMGSISTGTNGNVYVCGSFDSPTLNVGGYTLTRSGTLSNIFIACYSNAGAVLWAYSYGNDTSPYSATAKSCAYSTSENCLYVTGSFTGTLTIGSTTLTNATTNADLFLAKYSIASFSAAPVWAIKTGGSSAGDYGNSVKVDNSANVFIGGTFAPVTGSTSVIGVSVTSQGGQDGFVAKYNSAGTFQWTKTFGSTSGSDYVNNIALDPSSNVYVCGSYLNASLIFPTGSYTLTSIGANDGYFAKFNSSGTFQWANNIGGTSGSDYILGISTDASSNVYITGSYASSLTTIGTSTFTVPSSGSQNAFVAKYNTSNVFQWALSSTGTSSVSGYARAITNDNANNVYSSGTFYSNASITFDASTLTSVGQNDVYIAKISCLTPTITASNTNHSACINSINSFTSAINSPQSDVTYSWSAIGASGVIFSPTTGTTSAISYTGTSTFSIVITGTNTCSNVSATVGVVTINPLPTITITASSPSVCAGQPAVFTASGASTYTWNPAYIINGMPSINYGNGPFTVTATDANGCVNTNTVNFTEYPLPTISISGKTITCSGATNILTANGGVTYTWSPGSVVSSTYAANATSPTNYSVIAEDSHGCVGKDTLFTYSIVQPQTPDICEVTVDSLSQFNHIIWDKTTYTNVDSFIVYREVSTNIYKRVGAQDKNALSLFIDTARSVGPANGNPNITYYRYKLQIRDTCGNYSALSPYHNTLYFITNTTGTFFWNTYNIEFQPSTPVSTYDLIRDNNATGTWTIVGSASGTSSSLNDPAYLSYPNAIYRVIANGFNCNPTAKTTQQINKTKSNVKNNFNFIPTGMNLNTLYYGVSLAPNPATSQLTVFFSSVIPSATKIIVMDILGKELFYQEMQDGVSLDIPVNELSNGVYFVKVQQGQSSTVKRFIKE